MNAPFLHQRVRVSLADLADPGERRRIDEFVRRHPQGSPFHLRGWIVAIAAGLGNAAVGLLIDEHGELACGSPLTVAHSPVSGRLLASSGFAVAGGLLAANGFARGLG